MNQEEIVLLGILTTSTILALWLTINGGSRFGGKRWAEKQTWFTVVLGCGMIIAWGNLVDSHEETTKWLARFAVGGSVMILRSLWLQLLEGRE